MTTVAETSTSGDRAGQRADPRLRGLLQRPPAWPFHATAAVPTVAVLYSTSVPGVAFFTWLLAALALLAAAGLWTVRGLAYLHARRRRRARGSAAWYAVAPLGGLIVALLLAGSVPLRVRWAASESSFQGIVEDVRPTASVHDILPVPVPRHIGSYRIGHAYRQGDAVIFYEKTGAWFDDAGFAYLPSGPFPELESGSFESPSFRHLSGDWYAWRASW